MDPARWRFGGREFDLTARGMIMGVLNVTPDSFSDGGEYFSRDAAIAHGIALANDGADILDVGGESTRPGAEPVPLEEEIERVVPVLATLHEKVTSFLSIDTSKATVARAAIEAGATIVNDVTGGRGDVAMMSLVAERGVGFIIMHMQGTPQTMQREPKYHDVVGEVGDFFRQQYSCALSCGIDPMAIAFDPGIGFGKTLEHNLALLRNLPRLRIDDRPIVLGVSRKALLAKIIGSSEMGERAAATIAFTSLLRDRGANVLRVHEVKDNVAALRAAEVMRA
ncbi:MAG: dihydropteroate synthase [Verrucomicrobiota bacterium]|nr:dihydropteroate synthase [Verrucomicrobiota bacterium]